MGADWMREYAAAKLVQIKTALDELDALPDADEHQEERRQLLALLAKLMTAVATFTKEPASLN